MPGVHWQDVPVSLSQGNGPGFEASLGLLGAVRDPVVVPIVPAWSAREYRRPSTAISAERFPATNMRSRPGEDAALPMVAGRAWEQERIDISAAARIGSSAGWFDRHMYPRLR
jgi:hypothetical protein